MQADNSANSDDEQETIEEKDEDIKDEDQYEPDQRFEVCEECGDINLVRVVKGRVLCEPCADLIEDLPEEE